MERLPCALDEGRELVAKYVFGKPLGVDPADCRLDSVGVLLELPNRVSNRSFRLLIEEHAGRRVVLQTAYGLLRTAAGICDHRDATRLGLDRRDTEVFLRGEEKGARSAEETSGFVAVDASNKLHVRSRRGANFLNVGSGAGDNKPPVWKLGERARDQVDSLVRDESAHREVIVARAGTPAIVEIEIVDVDRRVDHR